MPYSTCCRKQNKPMGTTRITRDLVNDGFDPAIHLAIAQDGLRHLRQSLQELPKIEAEYAETLRAPQQTDSSFVKERMGVLAAKMKKLWDELEGAPGRIEALGKDIDFLMTIMARKQGDGHPGHSDSEGTEAGEGEDEVANAHSNGKRVSANEDIVKKEEKLEPKG
ncbi:MAG: hypothetical protein LQ341_004361 [Variospora aurantia]|nr:MAG: hypothetical protein LQ341_004361 [Variospora aurantia]